ncbi:hypothetical protein ACVWZV_008719 [Bradyrhizobium sp. GM5.1]
MADDGLAAGEVVDYLSANAALVLAEALSRKPRTARGDRLRGQDGWDDLGHGHPEGGLSEPSAGSDGIMTNAARNSLTLVKGVTTLMGGTIEQIWIRKTS